MPALSRSKLQPDDLQLLSFSIFDLIFSLSPSLFSLTCSYPFLAVFFLRFALSSVLSLLLLSFILEGQNGLSAPLFLGIVRRSHI